jgi:hypothetical protein
MAESLLHKQLKDAAEAWLRDNGCDIVMQEPTTVGRSTDRDRPDVIGVVTERRKVCPALGWNKWDAIEVECEPDLRGILAEAKKLAGRGGNYVSAANWTYLLHSSDIEPSDDIVHRDWGRLECVGDGAIRTTPRTAMWTPTNPYTLTPLLASMILNLQRATGKQAQEARSSHGSRLTKQDRDLIDDQLAQYADSEYPECSITALAKWTGIPRKKLLKACKAGIAGLVYDPDAQTLVMAEVTK